MCGEIDAHITRLEEQVRKLKEFCEWQRIMLESIFEAWDEWWDCDSSGVEELDTLKDVLTTARSASSMTGTSEE